MERFVGDQIMNPDISKDFYHPNFDDLIAAGLVQEKHQDGGLRVLKYRRKVFFKNLWHKDPRLLDARGLVLDSDGKVVQMPFSKIHNIFENNTLVDRDLPVIAPRKINGFLGAATWNDDRLLVSTTGSTTSEFVALAKRYLDKPQIIDLLQTHRSLTFLFEIVAPEDPHIIEEREGAYLIGARDKFIGSNLMTEDWLDMVAAGLLKDVVFRPEVWTGIFDDLRQHLKTVKHEGFVVRSAGSGEALCKLKSPHYLSKKGLMRLGSKGCELLWSKPAEFKKRLDEEFYALADYVRTTWTQQQWQEMPESVRRDEIESFFEGV